MWVDGSIAACYALREVKPNAVQAREARDKTGSNQGRVWLEFLELVAMYA